MSDYPTLFLDAASPRVTVGLALDTARAAVWRATDDEAGIGLSREIDALLREHRLALDDIRGVIWCDGPGSLLGIRLAAMMLRTWMALPRPQPLRVRAYRSLALVAADLLAAGTPPPFDVCSDARRETWNVLSVTPEGTWSDIRRCASTELTGEGAHRPLFHPQSFPHWQPLPPHARPAAYDPTRLAGLASSFPLLHDSPAPDAFMTELPTYRTWSGGRDSEPR